MLQTLHSPALFCTLLSVTSFDAAHEIEASQCFYATARTKEHP